MKVMLARKGRGGAKWSSQRGDGGGDGDGDDGCQKKGQMNEGRIMKDEWKDDEMSGTNYYGRLLANSPGSRRFRILGIYSVNRSISY
jgi:hypothetical protein